MSVRLFYVCQIGYTFHLGFGFGKSWFVFEIRRSILEELSKDAFLKNSKRNRSKRYNRKTTEKILEMMQTSRLFSNETVTNTNIYTDERERRTCRVTVSKGKTVEQ